MVKPDKAVNGRYFLNPAVLHKGNTFVEKVQKVTVKNIY